jgi:beta-lactamase class A
MSAPDVIGMVVAGTAIVSALLAGIIWLIRAQVAMQKQFQPNGGQSVRDSLNRIESDVRRVAEKVDDHIEWHMDQN